MCWASSGGWGSASAAANCWSTALIRISCAWAEDIVDALVSWIRDPGSSWSIEHRYKKSKTRNVWDAVMLKKGVPFQNKWKHMFKVALHASSSPTRSASLSESSWRSVCRKEVCAKSISTVCPCQSSMHCDVMLLMLAGLVRAALSIWKVADSLWAHSWTQAKTGVVVCTWTTYAL